MGVGVGVVVRSKGRGRSALLKLMELARQRRWWSRVGGMGGGWRSRLLLPAPPLPPLPGGLGGQPCYPASATGGWPRSQPSFRNLLLCAVISSSFWLRLCPAAFLRSSRRWCEPVGPTATSSCSCSSRPLSQGAASWSSPTTASSICPLESCPFDEHVDKDGRRLRKKLCRNCFAWGSSWDSGTGPGKKTTRFQHGGRPAAGGFYGFPILFLGGWMILFIWWWIRSSLPPVRSWCGPVVAAHGVVALGNGPGRPRGAAEEQTCSSPAMCPSTSCYDGSSISGRTCNIFFFSAAYCTYADRNRRW